MPYAEKHDPVIDAASVTPTDDTDLSSGITRALWIGTGGDLEVSFEDGSTVVFSNVPTGYLLPVQVTRVESTNTTASNILALY